MELSRPQKDQDRIRRTLNRLIEKTPNSNLIVAVPTSSLIRCVKYADNEVNNVFVLGTTSDFLLTSTVDCQEGRFFSEMESRSGANVCVIGYDVADALFPPRVQSINRS